MAETDGDDGGSGGRQGKVARLLSEYDLQDVGTELERRWTASGDARMSLRDLADWFNQQLLRTQLRDAGESPVEGEAENLYRLLTSDAVAEAERTRARRRLERNGVDVERLQELFVSYQSIRTYLQHQGAEAPSSDQDPVARQKENIEQLRGRTQTVTESKLEQLRDSGRLELGEFRTIVNLQVICHECGRQYQVSDLLDREGCDCRSAGS